jgi:hypothetical protein
MKGPHGQHLTTPLLLQLAMAAACLPVAFFAISVHLGAARLDSAVKTVGVEATQGITAAQRIKLNLSDLDGLVVQDLLRGATLGPSGFPDDYNKKRAELDANLILAASKVPAGAAYSQPLANIDYALAHYHALVRETFAASHRADTQQASLTYRSAHDVMSRTLLIQADSFDKANTYLLNSTYQRHKADASSTVQLIVVAWIVLLVLLCAVQLSLATKFRRFLNIPLAAATLLGLGSGIFVLSQLSSSSSDLTLAREHFFDPVHGLARARATVVAVRQSEAQMLLDPSGASGARTGFIAEVNKLFRVEGGAQVAFMAQADQIPAGAGGYLATVIQADVSRDGTAAARQTLVALGKFLEADSSLRTVAASTDTASAQAMFANQREFKQLTDSIDRAQAVDQSTFDVHAKAAADAIKHLDLSSGVIAGVVWALIILGLYGRLREYED